MDTKNIDWEKFAYIVSYREKIAKKVEEYKGHIVIYYNKRTFQISKYSTVRFGPLDSIELGVQGMKEVFDNSEVDDDSYEYGRTIYLDEESKTIYLIIWNGRPLYPSVLKVYKLK